MAALQILTTAAVLVAPPMAAASPVVSADVPVPGGITALARAIGLESVPDRARLVAELARIVYTDSHEKRADAGSKLRLLIAHFKAVASATARIEEPADVVPLPLTALVWSQAVFHRPVAPADLFVAVIADPAAAMLARGLAALDDETLRFLMDHPAMITRLYQRDAPVFAAFAAHLHIHNNRVVPPGGDQAVPLWEALLDETAAQPDRFVRELFARQKGRIAYLYDTIGHLDSPRAAFALGLWIQDASLRVDRFKALASAATSAFSEWPVKRFPFRRPPHDFVSLLSRVQVSATGAPGFPAWRTVWTRAFNSADSPEEPALELGNLEQQTLIDAAWLAEALMPGRDHSRVERLDQFAFGQRVFASSDAAALPDALVALRAFPRFRMLMLTLERIGVSRPSVYALLARQAQRLSELDATRGYTALAQFQGAIALVTRLASVRTIDRVQAETLLGTLGAVPSSADRGYGGALAEWIRDELRPALPAGDDVEDILLEALAGGAGAIPARAVAWEGREYRFDLVTSEGRRLRGIRQRQDGPSIDLALDLHAIALALAAHPIVAHAADPLVEFVDAVLGDALLALSYAVDLGDAEGIARFAGSVARRHDFGFARGGREARVRAAWLLPRQVLGPGVPWHVAGAVLGLDLALAPLALRRINADPLTSAPGISATERETFATSLALMNSFALQDAARDAIADAVSRGQRRVDALAGGDSDVNALAREIAMDGWRVRALQWTIRHDPQRIGSFFSMTDLLYLGGGRGADLQAWGMSAVSSLGCICTQLAAPGAWTALIGRPQLGLLGTTVADLNLRVAVMLHDLQLPAGLAKSVLAAAVQDFIDRVQPSDTDDWLTLVRTAQSLSRERIEDYVAAATAGGPLVPDITTKNSEFGVPNSEFPIPHSKFPRVP